ncbi:MAG: RNA polymerase sigma factor, partial [Planctomycetota bacterium]
MRRPADADLFRAWRDERSSVALDRLIDRLWAPTVRASFAVAHDLGDAEDSAQEAFLHLARRAEELRDPDAVQGWLRSIAVNHARHRVRARLRRKRNEAGAAQRRASALPAPEELVSRRLDAECVLPLLERLPEAQRTALRLHFVAGLTQREVASSMGSSAGTAASRIRLGLERLRRELVAVGPTLSVAALAALLAQGESRAAAIAQAARPPVASSLIVQAGGVRRSSPLFTMLCVCAGGLALLIALLIWFSQAEEPVGVARPEAGVVLATASGRAAETEDARSAPPGSSRSQEPTPSAPPVALAEPATSPNPVAGHAAIERSWFAGRVVDARTLEPIAHAKLYMSRELPWGFEEECPERAVTDAAGRFDVPWDTTPSEASTTRVQVAVCVSGYQPFVGALRLAPGGADAELRLEPHVSSDLQGRIAL